MVERGPVIKIAVRVSAVVGAIGLFGLSAKLIEQGENSLNSPDSPATYPVDINHPNAQYYSVRGRDGTTWYCRGETYQACYDIANPPTLPPTHGLSTNKNSTSFNASLSSSNNPES